MAVGPRVGTHYPKNDGHFHAWFATDADCHDYLEFLRWPEGFMCEKCGCGGWQLSDGRYECPSCHKRVSLTAGTIFDKTRMPLTVWFEAVWMFSVDTRGLSALQLQKRLGLRSYQTAWAMLARLRSVLARPTRDLLCGTVEVDETFVGGRTPGQRGGRQTGAKSLVGVVIENMTTGKAFGRCRLEVLPNANTQTLRQFLIDHVAVGSTVKTDGWQPYKRATQGLYTHVHNASPGALAAVHLPGAHRVASLLKRWLRHTHQGSIARSHLPLYLAEFEFRFNRRRSTHRGLLFYRMMSMAIGHDPVRYKHMLVNRRPGPKNPPQPPGANRSKTESLEVSRSGRPWRAA